MKARYALGSTVFLKCATEREPGVVVCHQHWMHTCEPIMVVRWCDRSESDHYESELVPEWKQTYKDPD